MFGLLLWIGTGSPALPGNGLYVASVSARQEPQLQRPRQSEITAAYWPIHETTGEIRMQLATDYVDPHTPLLATDCTKRWTNDELNRHILEAVRYGVRMERERILGATAHLTYGA